MADRYVRVEAILDHERARGGAVPAADDVVDTLLGPLYYRAVFTASAPGPDRPRRLVERLLTPTPAASG